MEIFSGIHVYEPCKKGDVRINEHTKKVSENSNLFNSEDCSLLSVDKTKGRRFFVL